MTAGGDGEVLGYKLPNQNYLAGKTASPGHGSSVSTSGVNTEDLSSRFLDAPSK